MHLADISDQSYFMPFAHCPGAGMHGKYLNLYSRGKHWVLLGEIVVVQAHKSYYLVLKDCNGTCFPLMLRGNIPWFVVSFMQKGNTIVLLYPRWHVCSGDPLGYGEMLFERGLDHVAVVPTSLQKVYELGKRLRIESMLPQDVLYRCHSCKKTPGPLQICNGCENYFFCNKRCFANSWKSGHKTECAAIRFLLPLLRVEFSNMQRLLKFPLEARPAAYITLEDIAAGLQIVTKEGKGNIDAAESGAGSAPSTTTTTAQMISKVGKVNMARLEWDDGEIPGATAEREESYAESSTPATLWGILRSGPTSGSVGDMGGC